MELSEIDEFWPNYENFIELRNSIIHDYNNDAHKDKSGTTVDVWYIKSNLYDIRNMLRTIADATDRKDREAKTQQTTFNTF